MDGQKEFTPNETRLYFFLLHLANRFYWKTEWFEYGDNKMQAEVGISAGSLRTARNNLKEAKLIDFITGGHGYRVRTRYQILTPNPNRNPDPFPEPIHYKKMSRIRQYKSTQHTITIRTNNFYPHTAIISSMCLVFLLSFLCSNGAAARLPVRFPVGRYHVLQHNQIYVTYTIPDVLPRQLRVHFHNASLY